MGNWSISKEWTLRLYKFVFTITIYGELGSKSSPPSQEAVKQRMQLYCVIAEDTKHVLIGLSVERSPDKLFTARRFNL